MPAARVEQLELELAGMQFPLDVTEGPARFRHRRTTVRSARVRLELTALRAAAAAHGLRVDVDNANRGSDHVVLTLRDAYGAVAADVVAVPEQADVLLVCSRLRCVVDGPGTLWGRWVAAARKLGLELEGDRGVLRLRRPVHAVLRELLVPRGWRIPDERTGRLEVRVEGSSVWLEVTRADPEEATLPEGPSRGRVALEHAALLAPALARLEQEDPEGAAGELEAARSRLHERAALDVQQRGPIEHALEQWQWLVALERSGRESRVRERVADADDEWAVALRTRLAARAGDGEQAAAAARRIAEAEPSAELVADALSTAVRLVAPQRPALAQELLGRAVARRPGDPELVARWLELAEQTGRLHGLEAVVRPVLAVGSPERARGRVAAHAARVLLAAQQHGAARTMAEEARRTAPHDPEVLEALAEVELSAGRREAAVDSLEQAAAAHARDGGGERAARALRQAAASLLQLGRPPAAETILERALEHHPRDVRAMVELARVRRAMGALGAAAQAYLGLLSAATSEDAHLEMLREAAEFQVEEHDDPDAARPLIDRYLRLGGSDEAVRSLQQKMARAEVDRWLQQPTSLPQCDEAMLQTIAAEAHPPWRAVAAMLQALQGAPEHPALRRAILGAARREGPEALRMLAAELVGLGAVPAEDALLDELASHADAAVRAQLEAYRRDRG